MLGKDFDRSVDVMVRIIHWAGQKLGAIVERKVAQKVAERQQQKIMAAPARTASSYQPPSARAQLQARYRAVPGAAGLQYYLDLAHIDPDELVRLYLIICAQKDPRIDLSDVGQIEFLRSKARSNLAGVVHEMQQGFDWAARNSPGAVLELRKLAGI